MNAGPFRTLLLGTANDDGSITGVTTGTSQPVDVRSYGLLTAYLAGTGTIAAGTVAIEEAEWTDKKGHYDGTWSLIYTFTASNVSGGAVQAYHFPSPTPYARVRARIDVTVSGSNTPLVTLVLVGE